DDSVAATYLVDERLARQVPADLVAHEPVPPPHQPWDRTPDVRGEQEVRHCPQWTVDPQRLRIGDADGGAAAAGGQLGGEGGRVHHRATRGVDEQRTVAHPGQEVGVDQPGGLRGQRNDEYDDVGVRQEGRQLVDAVYAVPRDTGDPGDRGDLERLQPGRGRLADRAR